MMIKAFNDFIKESTISESNMIDVYGFAYDYDRFQYLREDLKLSLEEYNNRWTLYKESDGHSAVVEELFTGEEDDMSEFIGRYIRVNKLEQILGD